MWLMTHLDTCGSRCPKMVLPSGETIAGCFSCTTIFSSVLVTGNYTYPKHIPTTIFVLHIKSGSWPNGIKLGSDLLVYQLLLQCLPRFDHQGEALGSPLLDPWFDAMGAKGIHD